MHRDINIIEMKDGRETMRISYETEMVDGFHSPLAIMVNRKDAVRMKGV